MMHEPEPALKKAMNLLKELSEDEEFRQQYEARQKFLRDQVSMMEGAREEGLKKGIEEGIKEGEAESKRKIAMNMLNLGLDRETIVKATGLTSAEVKAIQQEK
ncbi:Rpn family recombination-promoting nuclease/putative transposase [Paenibacillus xylanexedens]|uniref:Rpn family recombination-promoting nuclease/putative transposase n=1 Tax=Paenibacillus xylanexedens TaxID=528191 RepID=UPI0009FFB2F1|nr:Rpn family recombination-promoting nuclease/putative transposase [Paenibacillus xylanexedens]